jgi:hypothetical protein
LLLCMGLFSQFWVPLSDVPRAGHEAVNAWRRGEAIQLQAIMLWFGHQKSPFDDIDHKPLPQAVRKHATDKWALLYIERRMTARMGATTMRQQLDWRETLF